MRVKSDPYSKPPLDNKNHSLNVFVLIEQSFQKIPALKAIAPTQNDPPFNLTQLAVLGVFIALGIAAAIRFRIEPVSSTSEAKP